MEARRCIWRPRVGIKRLLIEKGAGLAAEMLSGNTALRCAECSCWIGGSWTGAGFTLVGFGLDLGVLWIGSSWSSNAYMTHQVVASI